MMLGLEDCAFLGNERSGQGQRSDTLIGIP